MYKYKHSWLVLGMLLGLFLVGQLFTGQEAFASYSFNYTGTDTVKNGTIGATVQFPSLIVNTGQADSFVVAWTENNPPTPPDWWARYCCGGQCYDSTVHTKTIYLTVNDTDWVYLDVMARSQGQGEWVISVQSKGNSVTKTKTFIMSAWQTPVTNEWGIIILILLLLSSAMYLMYRRLVRVKQT